jgi:hypothetical protein
VDVELAIAGVTCLLLAIGHWVIGWRWVLPGLWNADAPSTPFGPPSLSRGMVRFTWHIVTTVLVAFATLLLALGVDPDVDVRTLLLRWLAAFWFAAAAPAGWQARRRPSAIVRFPVPLLFVVVALTSWMAST